MLKISEKLYISYSLILLIFAAFLGKFMAFFLIAYAIAIIHELFHVFVSKYFDIKVLKFKFLPFGVTAQLDNKLIMKPEKEVLIAAAGPFSNVLGIFFAYIIHKNFYLPEAYYEFIICINVSMCLLNLFPIMPLDGGRIFRAILSKKWGFIKSYNFLIKLSKILTGILMIMAIFVFLIAEFNFSLVLILAFLLSNLTRENRNVSTKLMHEILNCDSKLSQINANSVKILAVSENFPARKLLKYFVDNSYYTIAVIGKDSKIAKILTETQVTKTLTSCSIKLNVGEI
jgi:stage IV sporulation protein FB